MANSMEAALDIYRLSVEDYHRMREAGILDENSRVELLNGQIVQMSPIGDRHAAYVEKLDELLRGILGKSVNIRIQSPIILNDYWQPEPNISILRRKDNFYADGHPQPKDVLLVVEVSDTTLAIDQQNKKQAYAQAGIPEYWIINIPGQQLEQYVKPENGDYQLGHIYKAGQSLQSDIIGSVPATAILSLS